MMKRVLTAIAVGRGADSASIRAAADDQAGRGAPEFRKYARQCRLCAAAEARMNGAVPN